VLLAVASAVIIAAPVVAHTRHRSRCLPHGSETIALDRSARVYSIPEYIEGVRHKGEGIYACLLRSGKTITLNPPRGNIPRQLNPITLAGTIMAFGEVRVLVDTGCTSIVVIDLSTTHTLLRIPRVSCFTDAGFVQEGQVTDLVVNPHGSVAWIASKGRRDALSFEVHSANTSGSMTLLDEGPQIVPGSLHLSGGEVTWRHGAHQVAANLR
jgi:hypothetical protein